MDRDQADGRALALKLDGPEAFYKQGRTLRLAAFPAKKPDRERFWPLGNSRWAARSA
jgi:hypothetical protein